MEKNKQQSWKMMILVIVSCVIMAITETVIEPPYAVKSALKVVFFLFVPLIFIKLQKEKLFDESFALDKKNALRLFLLGAAIYAVILGAYFLTNTLFDYAALVNSLSADQHVSSERFIGTAAYISFGNSLLEEFLFRLVAFKKLSAHTTKTAAYLFSSGMFALYHVAMIGASFPFPLLLLSLLGLAIGGAIFNYVNDKSNTIYSSWIIHMFADFAIMTIWYLHI